MQWINRNLADLLFVVGVAALNAPAYMTDKRIGLLVTGLSLITLSIIKKGGD